MIAVILGELGSSKGFRWRRAMHGGPGLRQSQKFNLWDTIIVKLYVCFSSIYIIYIIHRVLSKEMIFFGEWEVGRLSVRKKGDES